MSSLKNGVHYWSDILAHKFGGQLEFASSVMLRKFQQGGYIPVGSGYKAAI
jgi:hypothetical protein